VIPAFETLRSNDRTPLRGQSKARRGTERTQLECGGQDRPVVTTRGNMRPGDLRFVIRVGSRAGNAARRLGQLHRITLYPSFLLRPSSSSSSRPSPPFYPVSYTLRYYDPCLRLNCTHIFSSALPCSFSLSQNASPSTKYRLCPGSVQTSFYTLDKLYTNVIPKDILVFLQERPTDPRRPSKGSVFLTALLLASYLVSHRQGHRGALGSPRRQGKVRSDRTSQD
jgi:hypothetical protein